MSPLHYLLAVLLPLAHLAAGSVVLRGAHAVHRRSLELHGRARRNADGNETSGEEGGDRVPIVTGSAEFGGGAGGVGGGFGKLLCVKACVDSFKDSLENATGADFDSFQNGVFSDKVFQDDQFFENFCGDYAATEQCIDACGETALSKDITESMGPLNFICKDHYDEFVEYTPCYRESSAKSKATCEPLCGGEQFLKDRLESLGGIKEGGPPDFERLFEVMGEMCGFVECQLSCQTPILNEVCGSPKPAALMRQFVAQAIGTAVDKLDKIGLGALFPKECRSLAGKGKGEVDVRSVLESAPEGESKCDESGLYALKRTVLEKESEKLDLEIKKLKLELQKLEA